MTKDRACANGPALLNTADQNKTPYYPQNIYDPTKCRDPQAVSMWNRADQICGMCKVMICASDTAMNIDLMEAMKSQFEVMYQLADELRQGLEATQ